MDKIMSIKHKVRINEWSEMIKDCGMKTVFCCYIKGWTTDDFDGRVRKLKFNLFPMNSLYG